MNVESYIIRYRVADDSNFMRQTSIVHTLGGHRAT